MTRFVTKAAVAALVALPALAPAAAAQTQAGQAVDEKTGPVSFANVASVRLGGDPQHGGALITETQRSPLTPGQSQLGTDRVAVPKNDGERNTFGPNYEIDLGKYGDSSASPYPAGIASRDHQVVAALQTTHVPTAVAETNYALRDNGRKKPKPVDNTMLVLEGARSSVDCSGPGKVTGTTTAARVWVRGEDDALKQVAMPASGTLSVTGLKMGSPTDVPQSDPGKTTSDLVVSRVSGFDQLIKQDGWRSGDVTAQAGWRVEITTHARDAKDTKLSDVQTTMVLGGVSCSIPKDFVALAGNGSGSGSTVQQPSVPTEVPAGYLGPQAAAPSDDLRLPLGFGLLGGGLLFGAVAIVLGRRRAARVVRSRGE
ncbi:hypothetical protein [Amycolatopsis echigonensis]|uniref:Uncharacterized protein n=1 Tax=Amycolatopsis echigonensis TaxID=2576905 RepID=A0A8E2B455_9PSEU|nr:hypothetical protein [Amycolatopsis echigonensis]MBB2500402.1 hypothetical protein [Amycolatopsis echigonensis]